MGLITHFLSPFGVVEWAVSGSALGNLTRRSAGVGVGLGDGGCGPGAGGRESTPGPGSLRRIVSGRGAPGSVQGPACGLVGEDLAAILG